MCTLIAHLCDLYFTDTYICCITLRSSQDFNFTSGFMTWHKVIFFFLYCVYKVMVCEKNFHSCDEVVQSDQWNIIEGRVVLLNATI